MPNEDKPPAPTQLLPQGDIIGLIRQLLQRLLSLAPPEVLVEPFPVLEGAAARHIIVDRSAIPRRLRQVFREVFPSGGNRIVASDQGFRLPRSKVYARHDDDAEGQLAWRSRSALLEFTEAPEFLR